MNSPGNAALKVNIRPDPTASTLEPHPREVLKLAILCASSVDPTGTSSTLRCKGAPVLQRINSRITIYTCRYRYDGLYKVERVWSNPSTFFLDAESSRQAYIEEGKAGFKMCKFLLRVCFEIPRPPNSVVILTFPRSARIPFNRPFPPTSQEKERQTNTGRQAARPRRSQCQISTNPRRRPQIPRRRPSRRRGRRSRAKNACLPVSVSRRRPNECRAPDASFRCIFTTGRPEQCYQFLYMCIQPMVKASNTNTNKVILHSFYSLHL